MCPECTKGRTDANTVAQGTPSSALHMERNAVGPESRTTSRQYAI